MNDLRLFLLASGICVIAGIYIWGTLQNRRRQRHQTIHETSSLNDIPDVKIASNADTDIDYSSALQGLNQSISASREEPVNTVATGKVQQAHELLQDDEQTQAEAEEAAESNGIIRENNEAATINKQAQSISANTQQQIIILHIIPRGMGSLDGQAILQAVKALDMTFDDMQIFHHYGVGEMKMDKALFSLANILEPGIFDLEAMGNFTTPGLVLFMSLPTVIDGQVVFELMLNTAQRMADMLGADVCDASRELLNEQKIDSIRTSITV